MLQKRQEGALRKELSHRMHQENEAHGGIAHSSLSSNNHQWHNSGCPTQKSREQPRVAEQALSSLCARRAVT